MDFVEYTNPCHALTWYLTFFPCSVLLIILENAFGLLPRVRLFCECCVELIDKNEIRRRDTLNDGALKSLREVFRAKKSDDELTNMKDHQL